jgi:predicted RNA-binding Zn ribbon-like protein
MVAANLAIDFANTVVDPSGHPAGALRTWPDFVAFLKSTRSVEEPWITRNSRKSAAVFAVVRKLRGSIRDILAALASGEKVPRKPVESINRVLALHAGCPKLVLGQKGWELTHVRQRTDAARILFPIAEAAARIVTSGAKAGVRKCGNPACVLFFQDKTGRRRWCSMAVCGNRAKVAAFASRNKQ